MMPPKTLTKQTVICISSQNKLISLNPPGVLIFLYMAFDFKQKIQESNHLS